MPQENAIPQVVSVEDDAHLYTLIEMTLRPLPIKLHHASTAHDALEMIPAIKPDLLILDINLPDGYGWDVLKVVDEMDDVLVKGVIMLTAQKSPAHRVIARLQSVTAYITKPFKPKELRAMVAETLKLDI
ncbi:MAG TPA: response regulator [Anaerolineae bacterium]|nr:response regulator [Anaerolineae bacterium]